MSRLQPSSKLLRLGFRPHHRSNRTDLITSTIFDVKTACSCTGKLNAIVSKRNFVLTDLNNMSSPLPPPTQFPTLTPDTTVQLPHDDFGPRLNGIIWSLAAASATFLFTRVYFKVSRHRGLGWDDYVLVAAWVRYHARKRPQSSLADAAIDSTGYPSRVYICDD